VKTYTPGANHATTTTAPAPSSSGTVYVPHASGSAAGHTSASSGTTYTPNRGNAAETSRPAASSEGNRVSVSNGVTTYTPHAGGSNTASSGAGRPAAPTSSFSAGKSATPARQIYSVPSSAVASTTGKGNSMLTTSGSTSVVHQVNSARAGLTGINRRPIPAGQVTTHPNGGLTVKASDGRQYAVRSNGTLASFSKPGTQATFTRTGHVQSLHSGNVSVVRASHGQRVVTVNRPNHVTVVSTGRNQGYVQRTVPYNGHQYVQRTYVSGGARYTRVYAPYTYGRVALVNYVPRYYYAPAFYGWAYYPWAAPVVYPWGWVGAPWYGYYGPYFSVWPSYTGANYWLTDYYLGQVLQSAYQAQQPDQAPADANTDDQSAGDDSGSDQLFARTDTPISPDVKRAIAEEVQQQLSYESAASQSSQSADVTELPQVMTPNHVFVVDGPLFVTTADDASCTLSAGNVLRLRAAPDQNAVAADLTVVSSRRGDCPEGALVTLSLQDLQDMQNSFRQSLDSGLETLRAQQGRSGLPAAPPSAIAPPPRPTDMPPADDANVAAMVNSAQDDATRAEDQVVTTAFAGAPSGGQ
jgi:hypothetical protein